MCLYVFKCNDSSLSKLKFISQKNFDFICQNRAFLRRAQTHENTHEKKKSDHMFFPCAYAFSSSKIHLSHLKFISQKNFDFICQNRAFLRRAQTHENTHEKKKSDHMFFPCAYAFSSAKIHLSQLKFISQKNFDFICQNRAFLRRAQTHEKTHEKKNMDHIIFSCAYAFSRLYT